MFGASLTIGSTWCSFATQAALRPLFWIVGVQLPYMLEAIVNELE